jgi:hypothetical protein
MRVRIEGPCTTRPNGGRYKAPPSLKQTPAKLKSSLLLRGTLLRSDCWLDRYLIKKTLLSTMRDALWIPWQ